MDRIFDVTLPLSAELPVFPGDPPYARDEVLRLADGHPCNLSRLTLSAHAGTHVDAPRHFLPEGEAVDELPLDRLVGPARVVSVAPGRPAVGVDDLGDLEGATRVLFKTRNSGRPSHGAFAEDFAYLETEAAAALVACGVELVGIDSLSVERFGSRHFPVHHALLSAGVIIVEGLDLSAVEAGDYELVCLPLRVVGGDGAPARAILRRPA